MKTSAESVEIMRATERELDLAKTLLRKADERLAAIQNRDGIPDVRAEISVAEMRAEKASRWVRELRAKAAGDPHPGGKKRSFGTPEKEDDGSCDCDRHGDHAACSAVCEDLGCEKVNP